MSTAAIILCSLPLAAISAAAGVMAYEASKGSDDEMLAPACLFVALVAGMVSLVSIAALAARYLPGSA